MPDLATELTLETVLEIWQSTTARLEQTHLTLQAEVRRLTEELEEKNRQLAKKNRLADLGQMAGHVAHEVRNHLVPLTLYTNLLRRQCAQEKPNNPSNGQSLDCLTLIDRVEASLSSMSQMVHDLLNFTANRQPQVTAIGVATVLDELFAEIRPQCAAQNITLLQEISPEQTLNCDQEMLRSALRNLLFNALDALHQGGTVQVKVRPANDFLRIEIQDNGQGIPSQALPRIFDPFYTTKQTGTGLGLSIVERVMECHGGQVRVQSQAEVGTCFTLLFPMTRT